MRPKPFTLVDLNLDSNIAPAQVPSIGFLVKENALGVSVCQAMDRQVDKSVYRFYLRHRLKRESPKDSSTTFTGKLVKGSVVTPLPS